MTFQEVRGAPDSEPILNSLEQCQARLGGISRATLGRKLASGELKSVRLGGRVMIEESELKRFAAGLQPNGESAL